MIVIPLLLPSIAHTLEISKKVIWLRWLIGVLALLSLLLSSLVNFVGRRGLPYFKGYNIYWNTILKYFGVEPTESFSVLNFFNPTFFDYLVGIIIFLALLSLGYYLQRKISTRPSNTDNN
jgi:phosphoglycerol transferase MdoB-like AlkP superfamily enzyme